MDPWGEDLHSLYDDTTGTRSYVEATPRMPVFGIVAPATPLLLVGSEMADRLWLHRMHDLNTPYARAVLSQDPIYFPIPASLAPTLVPYDQDWPALAMIMTNNAPLLKAYLNPGELTLIGETTPAWEDRVVRTYSLSFSWPRFLGLWVLLNKGLAAYMKTGWDRLAELHPLDCGTLPAKKRLPPTTGRVLRLPVE